MLATPRTRTASFDESGSTVPFSFDSSFSFSLAAPAPAPARPSPVSRPARGAAAPAEPPRGKIDGALLLLYVTVGVGVLLFLGLFYAILMGTPAA